MDFLTGSSNVVAFGSRIGDGVYELVRGGIPAICPQKLMDALAFSGGEVAEVAKRPSLTIDELAELMKQMPNPDLPFDDYLAAGMACHFESGGSPEGFTAWNAWAARSEKYRSSDTAKRWASFNSDGNCQGIAARGTLDRLLREQGVPLPCPFDTVPDDVPGGDEGLTPGGRLVDRVMRAVTARLRNSTGEDLPDISAEPAAVAIADRIISRSFWNPRGARLEVLTRDHKLNEYKEADAVRLLFDMFGRLVRVTGGSAKARKEVLATIKTALLDFMKLERQGTNMAVRIDMFADEGHIEVTPDIVRVTLPHTPYPTGPCDPAVVADWEQHFPEYHDVLRFIVALRFAQDRKRGFLWMHCPSDWGKGMLIAVMNKLGASVELSVREVEKFFEGAPVGRSMADFKRAIMLVIDEFKNVKSEVKQLQNEISLAPKYQLTQTVEVFTKLFFSAEGVESLASEEVGIETQFANRFSYIVGKGRLTDREVHQTVGNACYFTALRNHMAGELNRMISEYQAMEPVDAEQAASRAVDAFYQKHTIRNRFDDFDCNLQEFADEFVQWVGACRNNSYRANAEVIQGSDGRRYLRKPGHAWGVWVDETHDHSVRTAIKRKKSEVFALIGDGKVKQRKIPCKQGFGSEKETYYENCKTLWLGW